TTMKGRLRRARMRWARRMGRRERVKLADERSEASESGGRPCLCRGRPGRGSRGRVSKRHGQSRSFLLSTSVLEDGGESRRGCWERKRGSVTGPGRQDTKGAVTCGRGRRPRRRQPGEA